MDSYESAFHKYLARLIEDRRDQEYAHLGAGLPQTFEAYREKVGYVRALNDILEWCRETEKELAKRH